MAALVAAAISPVLAGDGGGAGRGDGRPGRAGVLRLALTPLGSLDPADARSLEQLLVADQLFDSLTAVAPGSSTIGPSLAARWSADAEQRQWEFELRPDARFVNGRAVTAADVKYSLERVAALGPGGPPGELLASVVGYREFRQGAPELTGVTTSSPGVVRISLSEPWAELAAALSSPAFGIVPREAVDAPLPAFAEKPLGSGPFRLVERDGPRLSLAAVPGSKARVKGVDITVFDDVASAYRAFRRGEADWSRVPPEEVGSARRRSGDSVAPAYVAEFFYGFNLRNPKYADVRFREAVVRAVDRRAVVAAVFQDTASALDGLVEEAGCDRCGYDPVRARALLAETFPAGPSPDVGLDFDDDPAQAVIAQAARIGLGQVGVRAILRPRAAGGYDAFVRSGQQEVFGFVWVAAYPSPEAVLRPLFASASPDNLTGFSSPVVDDFLRRARSEGDAELRAALYRDAEAAVLDALPVMPVAQLAVHAVTSSRVRDLRPDIYGSFDAAAVRLAG